MKTETLKPSGIRTVGSPGRGQISVTTATQGWGTLQHNKSVGGRLLKVGGRIYSTGLGTHAFSRIQLELEKGYESFSGYCGIDSEVGSPPRAIFKIFSGKVLFESPIMKGGDEAVAFSVPVKGRTEIELIVEGKSSGGNPDAGVHADWLELRLEK